MGWKGLALVAIPVLLGVAYYRLDAFIEEQMFEAYPPAGTCDVSRKEPLERFSKFVSFKTVGNSSVPDHVNEDAKPIFRAAQDHLEASYPTVWSNFVVEKVGADHLTMMLKWAGSDSSLLPIVYVSHYDVVPVTNGTEAEWVHPPFSGAIADGYVWGRGTVDIKYSMVALLEAAEELLKEGFKPARTMYFCFGHDEELGGEQGAGKLAALLKSRGVEVEVVVDEGGMIKTDGLPPLSRYPTALVGVTEKVFTTLEVTLRSPGGHSSMPPIDASGISSQMARLLTYLDAHLPSPVMQEPLISMLKVAARRVARTARPALWFCDRWPFNYILGNTLAKVNGPTAATVRNTLALTRVHAGVANNVLPQMGLLSFNARRLHGTSQADMVSYLEAAISATKVDGSVVVNQAASAQGLDPVLTDSKGPHFRRLKQAIQEHWRVGHDAVDVAPYCMIGGTDSKHFREVSRHGVLRFVPFSLNATAGDLGLMHGTNERIPAEDFLRAICTFKRLMKLFDEPLDY